MAKDGTNRGGSRIGAGRKPKPLSEKITEGKVKGGQEQGSILPEPVPIEGVEVPPVKEYLKAKQKNGKDMCAEEVYKETYLWLKQKRCEKLVSPQLIEQYAMSVSRWIQCEEAISEFGFLAKHPTTGNAIASPYVQMSQTYMKQVNQVWYQIYQVVKDNCSVDYGGANPQDDLMERLRVNKDHVPYDLWERQGYLETTEGNVVHYGYIEKFIERLGERFNIREIAFDRWGAVQMVQNLEGMGFTVVPFGQGFKDMSPPTKELMKLVLEQRLGHSGHPVLSWMMDNVCARCDPAGNIKMDKEKSTEKIDGAVALVMALDRAIRCGNDTSESVYDSRGILFI